MTTTTTRKSRDNRLRVQPRESSIEQVLSDASTTRDQGRFWKKSYRRRVLLSDTLVVTTAVMCAQVMRFGTPKDENPYGGEIWVYLTLFSAVLIVLWLLALGMQESRDLALAPQGAEEFRRVASGTAWVFGVIAVVGLLLQLPMARGYLAIALPLGLAGLLVTRGLLRRNLARQRSKGQFTSQVVVLGKPDSIIGLCQSLQRSKFAGYNVVGACVPDFDDEVGSLLETPLGSVPLLGDERSIERAIRLTNADTLAVAAVEHLGHEKVKQLTWLLDTLAVDMIVMPGMTDIAGPRLRMRPIDNLPLFHISRPRHDGPSRYGKRLFDVVFAGLATIVLCPLMLAAALAIKQEDNGPVMYRQERVGQNRKKFRIFKFRTMVVDADARQQAERVAAGQSESVFYKSASDSRITTVGRILRKTSIDELPQLFNVLQGSMSIVGPRPLAVDEGNSVQHFIERRCLVKPGMTGLWQVSGRSNLSAEDRIRLDHSYIDNWSWIQDLVIVWRTIRAVLVQDGAR